MYRVLSARPVRPLYLPRTPCRSFAFTTRYQLPRVVPQLFNKATPAEVVEVPSFRKQIAKVAPVPSFEEKMEAPGMTNQVLFVLITSLVAYTLAAKKTNDDTTKWIEKLSHSGNLIWKLRNPSNEEIRRARHFELGKKLQNGLKSMQESLENFPTMIKNTAIWTYIQILQPVLDASEGKRVCYAIGLANLFVWSAWQLPSPAAQRFMMRHFTHNPLSGLSYTLLTSMFSHKSIFHLAFNCMALASFGSAATLWMMKAQSQRQGALPEATPKWHFLAFYISAGLFSGLVSHVIAVRFRFPRLIAQLKATAASAAQKGTNSAQSKIKEAMLPSLGASGAIYGAVTLTALSFPETEIALIFPPTPPIPIQLGVGGLVTLDIIGALRGWRLFDHWAHLGGAGFGAWYYSDGMKIWDMFRLANCDPAALKTMVGKPRQQ